MGVPSSAGRSSILAAVFAVALAGSMSVAGSSEACTPDSQCSGGRLIEERGTIPANAEGVVWNPRVLWGNEAEVDASHVELIEEPRESSTAVEVEVRELSRSDYSRNLVVVSPKSGFEPHKWYRFRGADFCRADGELGTEHDLEVAFQTGSSEPIPSEELRLNVVERTTGRLQVGRGASCTADVRAQQVAVEVEFTEAAGHWSDQWLYQTEVREVGSDGWGLWNPSRDHRTRGVPAQSWEGRGRDRLYTICESGSDIGVAANPGLDPGTYEVRIQMALPGMDADFGTEPRTLEFGCESSASDTGVRERDVADTYRGDSSDRSDLERSAARGRSGCSGCSTGPVGGPWGAPMVLVGIAAAVCRRLRAGRE